MTLRVTEGNFRVEITKEGAEGMTLLATKFSGGATKREVGSYGDPETYKTKRQIGSTSYEDIDIEIPFDPDQTPEVYRVFFEKYCNEDVTITKTAIKACPEVTPVGESEVYTCQPINYEPPEQNIKGGSADASTAKLKFAVNDFTYR